MNVLSCVSFVLLTSIGFVLEILILCQTVTLFCYAVNLKLKYLKFKLKKIKYILEDQPFRLRHIQVMYTILDF